MISLTLDQTDLPYETSFWEVIPEKVFMALSDGHWVSAETRLLIQFAAQKTDWNK